MKPKDKYGSTYYEGKVIDTSKPYGSWTVTLHFPSFKAYTKFMNWWCGVKKEMGE